MRKYVPDSGGVGRGTRPAVPRLHGVALVTVLAILTVLALLSALFATMVMIESEGGRNAHTSLQVHLLAQSADEHARAVLYADACDAAGVTHERQLWRRAFLDATALPVATNAPAGFAGARWFTVRNEAGGVVGRYVVAIEDEAGKINLNIAGLKQNQGASPAEVILTDGRERGLPLTIADARAIVASRHGDDGMPGRAGADDNFNSTECGGDMIDNDANGQIDEEGEGVDDPSEFNPARPGGDDRPLTSLNEMPRSCAEALRARPGAVRAFRSLATTHSVSHEMFYDARDRQWHPRLDVNTASRRQMQQMLNRANTDVPFESNTRNMRGLAANIMDYRDQNHVLTTMGGEYGVEAVCFNEIMANDGSFIKTNPGYFLDESANEYSWIHQFGYWYNPVYQYGHTNSQEEYGWTLDSVGSYGSGGSATILVQGRKQSMTTVNIRLGNPSSKLRGLKWFSDFKKLLDHDGWERDVFKNGCLWFRTNESDASACLYPIAGNDTRDGITLGCTSKALYDALKAYEGKPVRIETFWAQTFQAETLCCFPEQSDTWYVPVRKYKDITPPNDLYYYVLTSENMMDTVLQVADWGDHPFKYNYYEKKFGGLIKARGYCNKLDMDGDPTTYTETKIDTITQKDLENTTIKLRDNRTEQELLRFSYIGRKAVRARGGAIKLTVTSSRDCGTGTGPKRSSNAAVSANKNTIEAFGCFRPDIVELINVGHGPVSLRNWRVVINTGSYADQVGLIERAPHFSRALDNVYDDPNPVIEPQGYFYLTNNRDVFEQSYGSPADGTWGDGLDEGYPCFELPDTLWGARYEVERFDTTYITVKGADWQPDQMKGEIIEFRMNNKQQNDLNDITGYRKSVESSTKNTLHIDFPLLPRTIQPGDDVIILGLPRSGGFVSMTLKNEYGQVAARTIEYGTVSRQDLLYSTQKIDPAHYSWIKTTPPTFGGSKRRADYRSAQSASRPPTTVKNNRFVSVGEIQDVRTARDWENVGMGASGRGKTALLRGVAPYATVSGIRLDPEEPRVHVSGWTPAFAVATYADKNIVTTDRGGWTPDSWRGHSLRILSGRQKGESFRIVGNTGNGVTIDGYSDPGGVKLGLVKGDLFSLGPGYASAMFSTVHNGDAGVWEWQHRGIVPACYGLYVFGLNDSINTTEFLEENNNARIEAAVFNFHTAQFDELPMAGVGAGADDLYIRSDVMGGNNFVCDKNDGAYCGMIGPQHISLRGGIRLRLTPRKLEAPGCSGRAWFDYAVLAPADVPGKVNINTAPPRVLQALNGVTPALARDIALGVNPLGEARLKPYRSIGGLLDVRGFSDILFARNANLVTVNGDTFRIHVRAEVVKANAVSALREKDTVVRRILPTASTGTVRFTTLSIY